MPIDVYYTLLSPPARAVVVTAKHLNIDVNLKEVDLFAGGTHDPDYLKINPSHTVPTLVDNGFALFESRAILQYFINAYAPNSSLYPRDAQARASIDKVLYFDASAYYPAIRSVMLPRLRQTGDPSPEAVEDLKEKVHILESILGDARFFGGEEVSIADISLGVSIPILKLLYPSLVSLKIQSWYDRTLRDVPALEEYNDKVDYRPFLQKK